MAPPPEYDKEPKAPDKSVTGISTDDSKIHYNHVKEQPANTDPKSATATVGANTEVENNKHIETLDDGQLRALLDEAITYKCPKDREGKSSLFKELLEEVEQDEQACEAAARGPGAGRGGARRDRARREHHSSLQDLVAAMAGEPAPRRGRAPAHAHGPPAASVSARAHHGGSLPSGVDTSFLLGEEACGRGSYLATVHVVNPPPLGERRVSASDAHPPLADADLVARRSKPMFPMTYTARATLEIGGGGVGSGRAVTTTTASNQVDSAIPFGCITSPEVVGCGTVTSTTQAAAVDPKPRSVISSSFNGLPLSRPALGAADDYKKSLDENGNAVQAFNSPLSGSGQHKKPRRKKSSKNETVIKSHQIDGYQGNRDLDELLRFIESNDDAGRPKLRPKHKDDCDDKATKKRSTERRKDKDSKPKRASSLEELSRTTLEDLTDKPAPRAARRAAHPPAKPERRSWGHDARSPAAAAADDAPAELTDFQTVTKKKKPRRRADEPEHAPRPPRAPSTDHRARAPPPSLPASDRSNDSNDDMDSVHSLPAAPPPPPPPPPPHASYADIARTRHNIPDLIESCNFYAEGEAEAETVGAGVEAGAVPGDADQYPALEPRRARDKRPSPPAARPPRKEPDVVADRRPPVVLLDSAARSRDMEGITFGFDINEQLLSGLGGSGRRARCDLLRDAPDHAAARPPRALAYPPPPGPPPAPPPRPPPAPRYLPPLVPPDEPHLHRIIDYVGTAWDEVIRCGTGKVLYYTE